MVKHDGQLRKRDREIENGRQIAPVLHLEVQPVCHQPCAAPRYSRIQQVVASGLVPDPPHRRVAGVALDLSVEVVAWRSVLTTMTDGDPRPSFTPA